MPYDMFYVCLVMEEVPSSMVWWVFFGNCLNENGSQNVFFMFLLFYFTLIIKKKSIIPNFCLIFSIDLTLLS